MARSPYRSSLGTVTPKSLAELFGIAKDLEADDLLRLSYHVLPWKRVIVTVHVRPEPSLSQYFEKLASSRSVEVDVESSNEIRRVRYQLVRSHELRLVAEGYASHPVSALDEVIQGRVRLDSRIAFAIGGGECRFFVSSYDPTELAAKFERAFPWAELMLPPLVGRTWMMQL